MGCVICFKNGEEFHNNKHLYWIVCDECIEDEEENNEKNKYYKYSKIIEPYRYRKLFNRHNNFGDVKNYYKDYVYYSILYFP